MNAAARPMTAQIGLLAFLATATMLFIAFTAAYLIRRTASDWHRVSMPSILWANTGVLVASSIALEMGRRRSQRTWLGGALGLGLLFVGGQVAAWRSLMSNGVLLPTHPHASFLYVLTAVHALHLLGGLAALGYFVSRGGTLKLSAVYWHFITAIWIYVLILLHVL